jgi:6-phosphogluconolactonase/glucosamine-6-phosphate isomerase/deaminase
MEWHEVAATRRKRIVDRLHKGLPSVVWVDYKNGAGGDHFVVIVGMAPNGHLIMNDPATPSGNGAMNWQDSGNRIETSRQHYKIVDLLCIDPV